MLVWLIYMGVRWLKLVAYKIDNVSVQLQRSGFKCQYNVVKFMTVAYNFTYMKQYTIYLFFIMIMSKIVNFQYIFQITLTAGIC